VLEWQPVEFFSRKASLYLQESRQALGAYFNTQPENLVYMTNVTAALNAVVKSLSLKPGDQVLTTNQEYGAIDRTWKFYAQKEGYEYINLPIRLPLTTKEAYVTEFWRGVTPKTKVIFISHISASTSIIAPIQEICRRARENNIITVIDGAHAPGQIPVNLPEIGADFYGGNLHKWLCAPKGAGFLFAATQVQHLLDPLIVSFGWQSDQPGPSRLVNYFEYIGTRDLSAFLAVPDAIQFQAQHHWDDIRSQSHRFARECLESITALTGIEPLYTANSDWYAQMVTVPLPMDIEPSVFKERLYNEFKIEAPIIVWEGLKMIRLSFQAYNTHNDVETVVSAIRSIISK
jgi:isopenicillin-N epimerase